MSNSCQFILGGHSHPQGPYYDRCDAPASIKRDGVWLCAEHYDICEDNGVNYIAKDPNWLPVKITFED